MELIRDDIDLSEYMTEQVTEHRVISAADWTEDVIKHFHEHDITPKVFMPWLRTHQDFNLRSGEVTLWGGINGHGKSQIVGQVVLELAKQGQRIALASLEMRPAASMARMARQAYGADIPPKDYLRKFGAWTDEKLWVYDHVGSVRADVMLAVIRYAVDKFAVQHFVVDNLMKCGMGEDDYNGQKSFVDGLCTIAKDTGCHIHLVLHVKKGRDEFAMPTKFDIKGSGAITDLVDNAFIVWRNKKKEIDARSGVDFAPDEPDAMLLLVKQRHGEGHEGEYRLYFDRPSLQYAEYHTGIATHFKAEIGVCAHEIDF